MSISNHDHSAGIRLVGPTHQVQDFQNEAVGKGAIPVALAAGPYVVVESIHLGIVEGKPEDSLEVGSSSVARSPGSSEGEAEEQEPCPEPMHRGWPKGKQVGIVKAEEYSEI